MRGTSGDSGFSDHWKLGVGWALALVALLLLPTPCRCETPPCDLGVHELAVRRPDGNPAIFHRDFLSGFRGLQVTVFHPEAGDKTACEPGAVPVERYPVVVLSDGQAQAGPGTLQLARRLARRGTVVAWVALSPHADPADRRRYCALFGVAAASCTDDVFRQDLVLDLHATLKEFSRTVLPLLPDRIRDRVDVSGPALIGLGREASYGVLALAGADVQTAPGRDMTNFRKLEGLSRVTAFVATDPPPVEPLFRELSFDRILPGVVLVTASELEIFRALRTPRKLLLRLGGSSSSELNLEPGACAASTEAGQRCERLVHALESVLSARQRGDTTARALLESGARGALSISTGQPFLSEQADLHGVAGEPLSVRLQAHSPDPVELSYGCKQCPVGMAVDPLTGQLQWTPGSLQAGKHDALFSVRDGLFEVTRKVSIQVDPSPCGMMTLVSVSGPQVGIPGDSRSYRLSVHDPNPVQCPMLRVRLRVVPPLGWDHSLSQRTFEMRPGSSRDLILTVTPPSGVRRESAESFGIVVRHEDPLERPDSVASGFYWLR